MTIAGIHQKTKILLMKMIRKNEKYMDKMRPESWGFYIILCSVIIPLMMMIACADKKSEKDRFLKEISKIYGVSEWENYPGFELSLTERPECVSVIMDYYLEIHRATFCEKDEDCTFLKLHGCPISVNKESVRSIKYSYSGQIMKNECMPKEYFSYQASCIITKNQCSKEKKRCYTKELTDKELQEELKIQ
ncbi:MAG TPA: hypothetical protein PLZ43_16435 [bacterium]|nr:hypothetical protein [bacterium]